MPSGYCASQPDITNKNPKDSCKNVKIVLSFNPDSDILFTRKLIIPPGFSTAHPDKSQSPQPWSPNSSTQCLLYPEPVQASKADG